MPFVFGLLFSFQKLLAVGALPWQLLAGDGQDRVAPCLWDSAPWSACLSVCLSGGQGRELWLLSLAQTHQLCRIPDNLLKCP